MAATKEQLDKVNANLPRTNIKGKEYIDVAKRVQAFRELYPSGVIKTEILSDDAKRCTCKASVYERVNNELLLLATGHASETNNGRGVNATSMLENCETSAIGRALGFVGIGSVENIAAGDEVAHAIAQQDASKSKRAAYLKAIKDRENKCKSLGIKETGLASWLKAEYDETDIGKLNIDQLTAYGKHLASLIASKKELEAGV